MAGNGSSSREQSSEIHIESVRTETIALALMGTTPLIFNRMSEKAKTDVLFPKPRKTSAEKQASLKHNPMQEFAASAYTLPDGDALLAVMATAIKGAMRTAALDLPGASKAQIGRLVYVRGDYVPVYGIPQLFMSVVRQAGIVRAPDIRTRAIVPEWAVLAQITYVVPMLNPTAIANLLNAAGITVGIGDFRQEKGAGNYGLFRVTSAEDPAFVALRQAGERDAQAAAMKAPTFYDEDSERLFTWYEAERARRGK
jgi:hypothetical protein